MYKLDFELEIDGKIREYQFKGFSADELPSELDPCVYMFSKFDNNTSKWYHHYIGNTHLYKTFPLKDFRDFLKKYDANCVFIYEEQDEDLLLPIERAVREKFNIPFNFEKY